MDKITELKTSKQNRIATIFSSQSKDTASVVSGYLVMKELAQVTKTSHYAHALFNKPLIAFKTQALLKAVVQGDYKKVKKILQVSPGLLLERGTITDYSGRTHVNKTAYQLALGAGDFTIKNKEHLIVVKGMVEMIEKFFHKIPGKNYTEIQQIIGNQFQAQFPAQHEEKNIENRKNDSVALQAIIEIVKKTSNAHCYMTSVVENNIYQLTHTSNHENARELKCIIFQLLKSESKEDFENKFTSLWRVLSAQKLIEPAFDITLLKALYQFRWYLEPKVVHTLSQHFNFHLLTEAAQLYADNYALFGNNWENPKNIFCWQKILGYIERFLPACDAQSFVQGFASILKYGNKSMRTLTFHATNNNSFFPLDAVPEMSIGHNCAAPWCCSCGNPRWAQAEDLVLSELEFYITQKQPSPQRMSQQNLAITRSSHAL